MAVNVAAVMRYTNRYFVRGYVDGEFAVTGGVLSPAPEAAYVYISGSMMHDGAWHCEDGFLMGDGAPDETFSGRVWLLAPTADFLALCKAISAYDDKNPAGAYRSERFGEYEYTRVTGNDGASKTWQQAFAAQLAPYRRMYPEVV